MRTTRTTMAVALLMVAALAGSAYGQAQDYRWVGAIGGGSWNDANNWWDDSNTIGIPGVNDPNDTVDMAFGWLATRVIMMDVPGGTTVASLSGLSTSGNGLMLEADLTVGNLLSATNVDPNGHTLTVGRGRIYHLGIPRDRGSGGLVVKNTTGVAYTGLHPQWYTGDWRIDNGVLRSDDTQTFGATGTITVNDGGTLQLNDNRTSKGWADTLVLNGAAASARCTLPITTTISTAKRWSSIRTPRSLSRAARRCRFRATCPAGRTS